jgi:hypothetical protein
VPCRQRMRRVGGCDMGEREKVGVGLGVWWCVCGEGSKQRGTRHARYAAAALEPASYPPLTAAEQRFPAFRVREACDTRALAE